ncbi:peptidase M75, partial [Georgenia ruanii]|nr:peptidase M75 [Georgenia ruanii]
VPALAVVVILPLLALGACSSDAGTTGAASSAGPLRVTASDSACQLSDPTVPAGRTTLDITNSGKEVTEVYVYAGDKVVTEKENIGPGTSAQVAVDLAAGTYEVACKPGMVGNGIRTELTVRP